jgi:hypothetical protein
VGLIVVPASLALANASAALNSRTYPESLNAARHNMSQIEETNSFDSFDSIEDASNYLKKFRSQKSSHF